VQRAIATAYQPYQLENMANHRRRRAFYIHSPTVVVINKKPGTELAKLATLRMLLRAHIHISSNLESQICQKTGERRERVVFPQELRTQLLAIQLQTHVL